MHSHYRRTARTSRLRTRGQAQGARSAVRLSGSRSVFGGVQPEMPVIGTFGIVAPEKQTEKVVDAFSVVADKRREGVLVVVGPPAGPGVYERLRARVDELQLGDRVRLIGELDDEAFRRMVARPRLRFSSERCRWARVQLLSPTVSPPESRPWSQAWAQHESYRMPWLSRSRPTSHPTNLAANSSRCLTICRGGWSRAWRPKILRESIPSSGLHASFTRSWCWAAGRANKQLLSELRTESQPAHPAGGCPAARTETARTSGRCELEARKAPVGPRTKTAVPRRNESPSASSRVREGRGRGRSALGRAHPGRAMPCERERDVDGPATARRRVADVLGVGAHPAVGIDARDETRDARRRSHGMKSEWTVGGADASRHIGSGSVMKARVPASSRRREASGLVTTSRPVAGATLTGVSASPTGSAGPKV